MKITCLSCGKVYDTDRDELCPKCGSYNPFTRNSNYGREEKESSYHHEEKYREADLSGKAKLLRDKLENKVKEQAAENERRLSDKNASTQYKKHERNFRTKEQNYDTKRYSRETATKEKKEKGSIKGLITKLFAVYFILGAVIDAGSAGFFSELTARTQNELNAAKMTEVRFEQQETIAIDDKQELAVLDCKSVPISEEQAAIIAANSDRKTDGMQLTLITLSVELKEGFKTSDINSVYLKANDMVYRPLYIWELNDVFEKEYGVEIFRLYGYSIPKEGGILFLTPEGSQSDGYEFCIQQQKTLKPIDLVVTEKLMVVEVEEA